jgi:hypothetical protein
VIQQRSLLAVADSKTVNLGKLYRSSLFESQDRELPKG